MMMMMMMIWSSYFSISWSAKKKKLLIHWNMISESIRCFGIVIIFRWLHAWKECNYNFIRFVFYFFFSICLSVFLYSSDFFFFLSHRRKKNPTKYFNIQIFKFKIMKKHLHWQLFEIASFNRFYDIFYDFWSSKNRK